MSEVLIISDKKWASLPVLVEVESRFLDELAIIIQMCQTSLKTLCEWLRYKDLHLACYCDLIIPSVCPVFTGFIPRTAPDHPLFGTCTPPLGDNAPQAPLRYLTQTTKKGGE